MRSGAGSTAPGAPATPPCAAGRSPTSSAAGSACGSAAGTPGTRSGRPPRRRPIAPGSGVQVARRDHARARRVLGPGRPAAAPVDQPDVGRPVIPRRGGGGCPRRRTRVRGAVVGIGVRGRTPACRPPGSRRGPRGVLAVPWRLPRRPPAGGEGAGRPAGDRRGGHAPRRVPRDGRRRSADGFPRPARGIGSGMRSASWPLRLAAKVRLALEALQPMDCADRAVLSPPGQAWDLAEEFPQEQVGWSSTPSASGGIRTSGARSTGPGRASRPPRSATGLRRSEPTSSWPAATPATAASTSRHSPRLSTRPRTGATSRSRWSPGTPRPRSLANPASFDR